MKSFRVRLPDAVYMEATRQAERLNVMRDELIRRALVAFAADPAPPAPPVERRERPPSKESSPPPAQGDTLLTPPALRHGPVPAGDRRPASGHAATPMRAPKSDSADNLTIPLRVPGDQGVELPGE